MRGKIRKYELPRQAMHGPVNVPLPPGAQVISVSVEGFRPFLYAVGVGEATESRWFQLLWTSDPWPESEGAAFLGTVRATSAEAGGSVAWHVVELVALRGVH